MTIFSQFGILETLVSDNGPQYSSKEFADFAKWYDFNHITSSPLYAQSNGQAEHTAQTIKKIQGGSPDFYLSLFDTTPFPWCNLSPAELLMGQRLRVLLHSHVCCIVVQILLVEIRHEAYHGHILGIGFDVNAHIHLVHCQKYQ